MVSCGHGELGQCRENCNICVIDWGSVFCSSESGGALAAQASFFPLLLPSLAWCVLWVVTEWRWGMGDALGHQRRGSNSRAVAMVLGGWQGEVEGHV